MQHIQMINRGQHLKSNNKIRLKIIDAPSEAIIKYKLPLISIKV
jgi:hypothetical protein